MSLSLADALSHYRSVSDSTHRFWGYFQVVAAGAAAFAWSREKPAEPELFVLLAVAFAVFAFLNWRLVVSSQREAEVAAQCIKKYAISPGAGVPAVPADLLPIVERLAPDPQLVVGIWHAGLSFATLAAIGWKYQTLLS